MKVVRLVISDCHLGTGARRGQQNPLEDFHEDERLAEFIEHYSTGSYASHEVELILNGDIYDLIVKGKDKMVGEGDRLAPAKVWGLVNYVRSLAKK